MIVQIQKVLESFLHYRVFCCGKGRAAAVAVMCRRADKEHLPDLKIQIRHGMGVHCCGEPVYQLGRQTHRHTVCYIKAARRNRVVGYPGMAEVFHRTQICSAAAGCAVFKNNIRKAFAQALIHSLETLVVTPIAVLKIAVAHIARIWHIVDMVEIQTEHIHLCVFYHPYDMIFNPGIRFILCQIHNASNPLFGESAVILLVVAHCDKTGAFFCRV